MIFALAKSWPLTHVAGANHIHGVNMSMPTYLPTDVYNQLLDRLETVRPTANQPCVRSAIIEILGEIADVWPDTCLEGEDTIPMMAAA